MKNTFAILIFILAAQAFAATRIVIPAPLDHLYVPKGFDNNDSVEMVVTGNFPSVCYSRNTVEVRVVDNEIRVQVTALVSLELYKDPKWCPPMLIPYKEVISLGNLQGGDYNVVVNQGSRFQLKSQLTVMEASSNSVDDHVYAGVTQLVKKDNGQYVLEAMEYSDCYALDRVEFLSNDKDTISVLPIMKRVKDSCPMKGNLVEYPVSLDLSSMKVKKPLMYIRTIDGKSISQIINKEDQR